MALAPHSNRSIGLAAVAVVLVASFPSYASIPGWDSAMGLDLRNLVAFHACAAHDDPYLATGAACGDPLGRAMPYPPLMYWAFVWTRWVPMPRAHSIWAAGVAACLLLSGAGWILANRTQRSRWPEAFLVGFLLVQYPAMFAMQRGNNDALVVLIWTAAALAMARDRPLTAGCAAGAAAAMKIYPATGCAILMAGVAGHILARQRAGSALRLAAGIVMAPAVAALAFWTQTLHYVTRVLPAFARHLPAVSLYSHSIPATFGAASPFVSAAITLGWAAAAALRLQRSPLEIFAGALAASTYVARTSFDYNLVSAYPLLLVQLSGAIARRPRASAGTFGALLVGLLAIVGHRGWFDGHPTLHVALQVVWLLGSAVLAILAEKDEHRAVSVEGREHSVVP